MKSGATRANSPASVAVAPISGHRAERACFEVASRMVEASMQGITALAPFARPYRAIGWAHRADILRMPDRNRVSGYAVQRVRNALAPTSGPLVALAPRTRAEAQVLAVARQRHVWRWPRFYLGQCLLELGPEQLPPKRMVCHVAPFVSLPHSGGERLTSPRPPTNGRFRLYAFRPLHEKSSYSVPRHVYCAARSSM